MALESLQLSEKLQPPYDAHTDRHKNIHNEVYGNNSEVLAFNGGLKVNTASAYLPGLDLSFAQASDNADAIGDFTGMHPVDIAQVPAPVSFEDQLAASPLEQLKASGDGQGIRDYFSQKADEAQRLHLAQVHYLDDEPMERYWSKPKDLRGTMPFVDTGDTVDPANPNSWRLPKPENYKGWMPGDSFNPLTWADDSSKYIQEVMKENFVINSAGKRVPLSDESLTKDFRDRFGNAARHAIGMGHLIFQESYDPKVAETMMMLHEPQSWVAGAIKSAQTKSVEPWNHNAKDSAVDIANNAYAARESAKFHNFDSFARQMLKDALDSAKKGTGDIGVPLGTK